MKRKINILKLTLLLILPCIMLNCHDDQTLKEDLQFPSEGFSISNGMLKFNSSVDFENTLQKLISSQDNLDVWEKNLTGFTSMRTSFDRITEDVQQVIGNSKSPGVYENILTLTGTGDDLEARMNIDDLVLATLVNSDGLIQIGSDVYKISYYKLYKTSAANIADLKKITSSHSGERLADRNVEEFDVIHNYSSVDVQGRVMADRECDQRYSSSKKRLKGEQWTTNIGALYSGAGARTKHQRKVLGIWWRNKTNQLRLRATGSYIQYFNGIPSPAIPVNEDSGWQSDDGREAYTFDFCVNVSCLFQITSLTSIHECTCDDNAYRKCEIVF